MIHPLAQVSADAKIGPNTRVGAFATIEAGVVVGESCEIHEHAILRRGCKLGDRVKVHSFAVLGGEPQHLKYRGEETYAEVGDDVTIREFVTVNRGTPVGTGTTIVGSESYLMAYSHVGHDAVVGRGVVLANNVQLAGHSEVGDYATLGGSCAVVQFCRIGRFAYVGGFAPVRKDIAPFVLAKGAEEARPFGINAIGLERRGFAPEAIQRLKKVYRRFFFRDGVPMAQALEGIQVDFGAFPEVEEFVAFVKASKAGLAAR
jgi:UDP-N-acetylglucosamine acyltransferase